MEYTLVVRNRAPYFARIFFLAFLVMTATISWVAYRDGAPAGSGPFLIYILLVFWAVGLGALIYAMNSEASVLTIAGKRSIRILRGGAFRRREEHCDEAKLWIAECRDSEGIAYFELRMDASGSELIIQEGWDRHHLVDLQHQIEAAVEGNSKLPSP